MTDCDFLYDVLSDNRPHSLNEILRRSFAERGCGLTVHSRVADLRKRGHVIHCERDPKARRGDAYLYTLASLPTAPVSFSRPPASDGIGAAGSEAQVWGRHGVQGDPATIGSSSSSSETPPPVQLELA